MIVYRTQFPLSLNKNIEDVLVIGRAWIMGSPHSHLKEDLSCIPKGTLEIDIKSKGEELVTKYYKDDNEEILGLKYFVSEANKFEWTTNIVANKSAEVFLISIDISCESSVATRSIPQPKRPFILNHLLTLVSGGRDGAFVPDGKPIKLEDVDIALAATIINGLGGNTMPVVYVSSTRLGKYVINPSILSNRLYGLAHVIVEPNRQFSFRLRLDTASQNAFGGAIGIYWPYGLGKEILVRNTEHNEFIQQISNIIIQSLVTRRLLKECSWIYLEQKINAIRYEALKNDGETNLQKYISAFDEDSRVKDVLLHDADEEIKLLQKELYKLSTKLKAQPIGNLLVTGDEAELYNGEKHDLIMCILNSARASSQLNTRRKHLLDDICDANDLIGEGECIKDKIKEVVSKWDGSPRSKNHLSQLGFELMEDGKHIKAYYNGDTRYVLTLPKTPSDVRTGMNTVRDLNHLLF